MGQLNDRRLVDGVAGRLAAWQPGLACKTVRMARTYWVDLFTIETWKEFLDHGGDVSGFSEKRRVTVQRMKTR